MKRPLTYLDVRDHKQQPSNPLYPLWLVTRGWGHPGYQWYAVTSDGALLCEGCCRKEYRQVVAATLDPTDRSGWRVVGFTNSGEMDDNEPCAHCGTWLGPEPDALHGDYEPDGAA